MGERECDLHELLCEYRIALRRASDGDWLEMRWLARVQESLRHAVILEGANVPCELVRDGGGG